MQIEEKWVGDVLVLSVLDERIDARNAVAFKQSVGTIVASGNRRILVDLTKVTFVDSTGLGSLVGGMKAVGKDGSFVVCGLNESVNTLFKLTRMDKVFRSFATPADALSALGSAR